MNIDDVRIGLAELQAPVVPAADPYGRLLGRARRSRRNRLGGGFAGGLAALVAVVMAVSLSAGPSQGSAFPGGTTTPDGPDGVGGEGITAWGQKLLDSPTVGGLAGDTGFRDELLGGLSPTDFTLRPELNQRTLLFAGDVGGYRAVLVVLHSTTNAAAIWLVGPIGTTAAQFVQAAEDDSAIHQATPTADPPITVLQTEFQPFLVTAVGVPGPYLALGVAPAGCQVATGRDPVDPVWTDSADGRLVVLTNVRVNGVAARVTCDGVLRYRAMLTQNVRTRVYDQVSDEQVTAAMTGARGTPANRADVLAGIEDLLFYFGADPDQCRLLFSGAFPHSPDPRVTLVACGTPDGHTLYEEVVDGNRWGGGAALVSFTSANAVFGLTMPQAQQSPTPGGRLWTILLASPAASRVDLVRPGRPVESVPLVGGVGAVQIPYGETVTVKAVDSIGTVLGTGTAPLGTVPATHQAGFLVQNWD
jgi:hypothetical protein